MRATKAAIWLVFTATTACAQLSSVGSPEGLTRVRGIEREGLDSPMWSPDGNQISVGYTIYPMPDIIGFFGSEPRHDLVMIDTNTWTSTIVTSQDSGSFSPEGWTPDGKGVVVSWSDGYGEGGIYLFNLDGTRSTHLAEHGVVSPDVNKAADFDNSSVRITDVHTNELIDFPVPTPGSWYVNSWSPDMKQLALVYGENEKARFQNIYLLELDSGKFVQFTDESNFFKHSPTFSPSGQFVAYIMWRFGDHEIESKLVVSRLDQSCQWSLPQVKVNYYAWSPDSRRMFVSGSDGVYVADLDTLFGSGFSGGSACP